MQRLSPKVIIMLTGAALILVGVLLVGFQLIFESLHSSAVPTATLQHIDASPKQFRVTTRFVGLEIVVVGAVLEIVGYLSTAPWKSN